MHLPRLSHSKGSHEVLNGPSGFHKIGRDPYVDWAIIFLITVLVGIVLVSLGLLTYEDAESRLNASPTPSVNASVKFDQDALTNLLSKFDARAAEQSKLLKAYDGPGDPSL